ncbi:MAG: OsmC family protein [Deltaproteobacteria bacterium]|nr:OsmC family protein [Deltaproteobacteria bacterium]
MRSTIHWSGESFDAKTESGHTVKMDGPPSLGGQDRGPRPMEVVLAGAGGCTSVDVVHILRKGRHDVRDCRVEIEADRAKEDPQVFTRIHFHYVVTGKGLKPDRVEQAIKLSAQTYCSAIAMLSKTAKISWDFEAIDPDKAR